LSHDVAICSQKLAAQKSDAISPVNVGRHLYSL